MRIPAAGPLAAIVTSEAAAVVAGVARFSGDEAGAAQAEALRARAKALAAADAEAFVAASARLAGRSGDDFALGRALADAADVLLQIADTAADVVALAAVVAGHARPELRPDGIGAAALAEAAVRVAAGLVEVNLAVSAGDERSEHGRVTVAAAAESLAAAYTSQTIPS